MRITGRRNQFEPKSNADNILFKHEMSFGEII